MTDSTVLQDFTRGGPEEEGAAVKGVGYGADARSGGEGGGSGGDKIPERLDERVRRFWEASKKRRQTFSKVYRRHDSYTRDMLARGRRCVISYKKKILEH